MNSTYTFRLDERTNKKLHMMAFRTYRSRAGVLRLLIDYAAQNMDVVFSNVGGSLSDPDIVEKPLSEKSVEVPS